MHSTSPPRRDHPRLCGEKWQKKTLLQNSRGSPPPMRGKVDTRHLFPLWAGITPAYAGKSPKWTESQLRTWDHPRLCGEKRLVLGRTTAHTGSPPPMRGKAKCGSDNVSVQGITPAYAGKSLTGTVWTRPPRDHPRLCGEKPASSSLVRFQPGSPPPMRGKGPDRFGNCAHNRITPAYAGKRPAEHSVKRYERDHPRLCGEK